MKLLLPLVALALLAPLAAKDKKPPAPTGDEVVVLDPVKVRGTATSNFAIDIRILVNADTRKVFKIIIAKVYEDTDAADLGLESGDEIARIDGVPVEGMDPKIDIASQIGQIFLNRHPGDTLRLEVITRRTRKVTLRAQLGVR